MSRSEKEGKRKRNQALALPRPGGYEGLNLKSPCSGGTNLNPYVVAASSQTEQHPNTVKLSTPNRQQKKNGGESEMATDVLSSGTSVVNENVWYKIGNQMYYGKVEGWDASTGKHSIRFNDGDFGWYSDLRKNHKATVGCERIRDKRLALRSVPDDSCTGTPRSIRRHRDGSAAASGDGVGKNTSLSASLRRGNRGLDAVDKLLPKRVKLSAAAQPSKVTKKSARGDLGKAGKTEKAVKRAPSRAAREERGAKMVDGKKAVTSPAAPPAAPQARKRSSKRSQRRCMQCARAESVDWYGAEISALKCDVCQPETRRTPSNRFGVM